MPDSNGRVGIIQPLPGIGDMVWHLPAIHAIAAHVGAPVVVLTKPRSRADQLLAADPRVAGVEWVGTDEGGEKNASPGALQLARRLRQLRLDTVFVLHCSWRYAFAAAFAGIATRIGYGAREQRLFLTRSARFAARDVAASAIDKASTFLDRLGISVAEAEPRLTVDAGAAAAMRATFAARPRPWLVIGLGSSEPWKQWGAERFVALIAALGGAGTVFLVGGPAERDIAQAVLHAAASSHVVDRVGSTLGESMALLAAADLYVGNDTGMLNVAAAVGTHAVGLFGATPVLTNSRCIHAVVPPGGPSRDGMAKIAVEAVAARVASILVSDAAADRQ